MELEYDQNIVYQKDGIQGHICQMSNFFKQDVIDEYGRLFSAAPDLLNALIMCINYVGGISKQSEPAMNAWLAAKAAIEKATKGNLITPANNQLSPVPEMNY